VRNASRFDKPRFRAGVSAEVARARSSRRRLRDGDRIPLAGTRLVRRAARASER
jgi:hypothetical protein